MSALYLYLWSTSFIDTSVLNLFWCSPGYGSDCATHWLIACSRLSDSEEDAKVKGARKVGGTGKRKKVLPVLVRVREPDYLEP